MRIVHINLFDALGGAASAAWTLMNHMSKQGHDVHIFAHRKTTDDPRVIPLPTSQNGWQKKMLTEQSKLGLFDLYSTSLLQVLEHPLFEQADIIHLHCINGGYFSYFLLPFLTAKPTIWTLHDPLAFTGGCYNTDDCSGWQHDWCAHCPLDEPGALVNKPQRQLMQLLKASIYKMIDFTAVCPSKWLQKQVGSSILKNHDVRLIPYGIDLGIYRPGHKQELRAKLGLPADQPLIMFAAHGGFNDPRKGGKFLIEALQKIHDKYPELLLLNIGTFDQSVTRYLPVQHMDLPFIDDKQKLAEYYQAADLFITPALAENLGLTAIEASACGTPVIAFNVGGTPEIIRHKETGYLAKKGDSDDLAQGITYFLDDEVVRQSAGEAARQRAVENFNDQRMVNEYTQLYEEIKHTKGWTMGAHLSTIRPTNMMEFVNNAKRSGGWDQAWHEFRQVYKSYAPHETSARNIFVDEFYGYCLKILDVKNDSAIMWGIIENWPVYRYLPARSGNLPGEETRVLLKFSYILRTKIHEYLIQLPSPQMPPLEGKQEVALINVWWHVFFNYFSILNLHGDSLGIPQEYDKENAADDNNKKYINLLLVSLYDPFHAENFDINMITLWNEPDLPNYCKVIISFWLTNIPYYNIEEGQRKRLLKHGSDLCQIKVPSVFFDSMVNHISNSFWLVSYAGGNNVSSLSSFGDFIVGHMSRFYPQYSSCKQRQGKDGDKIRIGYISRCFYHQSVSYYMVNRVIHHDRDKFQVYVFALGERNDDMTKVFSDHASSFQRFPQLSDLKMIAQSIDDSQLDILIYTEIGMDPATYMLAGMQLAPIQCAMVGHGTTTGLPTIQYYLSGDFESFEAQFHYREQLVRLPNLGAAQYPPPLGSSMTSTRKDWKIPEDAVVFVSCANGIKHVPERDKILVEILKRVPNACIAIKPYNSYDTGQQMNTRIMAVAKEAGVENRLFIVPPLKHVGPLLSIADIQLDTYPYNGWTTNMEALYMGIPIITQEGDMARSRWGAFMLRALGVYEGIATSGDEYVEWAVRFAQDKKLRLDVRDRIMSQGKQILFNGASAQDVYEDVLLKIFAQNS